MTLGICKQLSSACVKIALGAERTRNLQAFKLMVCEKWMAVDPCLAGCHVSKPE